MKLAEMEQRWQNRWLKIGRLFPPGYGVRAEVNCGAFLVAMGAAMTLDFFERLHMAYQNLYVYATYSGSGLDRRRILREGAIAESFAELVEGFWLCFLPWLIFLLVNCIVHYSYYFRETKSIYVMRRIASRRPMINSCVLGTLFQMVVGAAAILTWYLLLFGIYWWVIPNVCHPRLI